MVKEKEATAFWLIALFLRGFSHGFELPTFVTSNSFAAMAQYHVDVAPSADAVQLHDHGGQPYQQADVESWAQGAVLFVKTDLAVRCILQLAVNSSIPRLMQQRPHS
jgi:hypothetical protein